MTRVNYCALELEAGAKDFTVETTVTFLQTMLAEHSHIRDDYQQLIELTLIILVSPPTTINWRAPGPVNLTRCMAKLLYAMKIYLFHNQRHVFKLTTKEEAQLQRIVLFVALLYTSLGRKPHLLRTILVAI